VRARGSASGKGEKEEDKQNLPPDVNRLKVQQLPRQHRPLRPPAPAAPADAHLNPRLEHPINHGFAQLFRLQELALFDGRGRGGTYPSIRTTRHHSQLQRDGTGMLKWEQR
jgi:hypothetical protein